MNTTCHFCGNINFKATTTQYIYRHRGRFLVIDDVPCEQCEYCGEQYFDGDTLRRIEEEFQQIHLHGKPAKREISMPAERFMELQYA